MSGSYLTPLPVWALISPSCGLEFEDMLCLGSWAVPFSGLVPGLVPIHSFTHLPGVLGHGDTELRGPPFSGGNCEEGKSWKWGTSASQACQHGPGPGPRLCGGSQGTLCVPKDTIPSWTHPVCWHAFIPAGVGETQDTEDTPVLGLCGTWEGVRQTDRPEIVGRGFTADTGAEWG